MDIDLTVNGEPYSICTSQVSIDDQSLNSFIRQDVSLTGSKVMCREGGCGACVVTIGRTHPLTKVYETFAVNSCLVPLYACNGIDVTTVEGLGDRLRGYHPLQKRLNECSGSQCGYCTSGMLMNMHGLMASGLPLTMRTIERGLSGNMCRCTGYRPILDAFKSFAHNAPTELVNKFRNVDSDLEEDIEDLTGVCPRKTFSCSPKMCIKRNSSVVIYQCKVWHRVTNIPDLQIALHAVPDDLYMLVAGNTAQGISRIPNNIHTFIDITPIEELYIVEQTSTSLTIGSLVTLKDTLKLMKESVSMDGFDYLNDLLEHFELVANVPVRNIGTIGGNLCYKQKHNEFPSDVFVCLDTADCRLTILDCDDKRSSVTMTEFLTMNMHQKILYNAVLPRLSSEHIFRTYKVSIRIQNAHAYVNAGFSIHLNNNDGTVVSARICYGGISPRFTHASNTEKLLLGRELFSNSTLQSALISLSNELNPDWVLPESQPEYRKNLGLALFYRFILSTCPTEKLKGINFSGAQPMLRNISSGIQTFQTIEKNWPLTKPVEKYEGLQQTSGEVKYINDIPPLNKELWAAFSVATKVNAKIASIDPKEALDFPGVQFFFGAKNIPGKNNFTPIAAFTTEVEEIFVPIGGKVLFNAQPVGMVLADTFVIAVHAAKLVKITYQTTYEATGLVSIARSLLGNLVGTQEDTSIYPTLRDVPSDKLHSIPVLVDFTVRGRFELAGQYHYTMETQCAVALPDEKELTVYSSTQWVDFTQNAIADCLAIPVNQINMMVRRLGGAYGSKISRATLIACATALGSHLTNRPVRFSMSMEANMKTIGKRNGIIGDYVVKVNGNGRITNMINKFSQDAGCSNNEPADAATQLNFSNCYDSTEWNVSGSMVLTDAPSSTFCRSPSTLEGIAMIEAVMEHIAFETGLDPMALRRANMKPDHPMQKLSIDFAKSIDFDKRKAACDDFNANNRWKKRGIAAVPMSWPGLYLGIIPGYVAIYHYDGTVAVTHGGVECGQGINTKVAQVAAFALGLPLESISVKPMDNVTSANAMVTGSSVTSEMSCYAIKKACDVLLERIRPIRATMPAGYTWPQLIAACHNKNIDLRATCQFKDTDIPSYNIYGLAAAEMQLDVLTGVCQIERVDIWEDVGESMSPQVDVGQVEGAFVMGIGYYLTEELVYDRISGELLTDRTWYYKVPGALDIPIDFRIHFIQNSPNPTAGVLRSKATGEPAICMSIVVLCALRHAINSARKDAGLPKEWVPLGSATTPEVIFLKCGNKFSDFDL